MMHSLMGNPVLLLVVEDLVPKRISRIMVLSKLILHVVPGRGSGFSYIL